MTEVALPMTLKAGPSLMVPQDIEQPAMELDEASLNKIKSLADQGHTKSQFGLGQHLLSMGDHVGARRLFERAGEMGEMQALYQLAVMFYDGVGMLPQMRRGVELLKEVSQSQDPAYIYLVPHAQYNLGMAAFMGYGMPQDDEIAQHYWLLAGKEGDPDGSVAAQSQLGMYYTRRDTKDVKKAFYWHYFAAENGSLESKGALGVMYYEGVGTIKDKELAFKNLCEASERGSLFAQGNLVKYYYEGRLFTRAAHCAWSIAQVVNIEEACEKSNTLLEYTQRGVALGCFYYARCLQLGKGVGKNEEDALKYYKKAFTTCSTTASELNQKMKNDEL